MSSSHLKIEGTTTPQYNSNNKQVFSGHWKKQFKIISDLCVTRKKMILGISAMVLIAILLVGNVAAWSFTDLGTPFNAERPNNFGLDVLPEYKLEKHTFTTYVELESNNPGETVLYRIPSGPKSTPRNDKPPILLQHGILCDVDHCAVNQPLIAIAYLLVDQGYDVWLGEGNFSGVENIISSENVERQRLVPVAQYVLAQTHQPELSVMGFFNGSSRIFGITGSHEELNREESQLSKWFDKIPGVQTAKKWYNKSKNYLTSSYDKVVDSFDTLGRKIDYVIDDLSIRELKAKVLNGWGMLSNMVVSKLNIDDFSKMIDHPDVHLSTPELVRKYGYDVETHTFETQDGYLLTAHRITGGRKHPPRTGKPVVILQHGILSSSADWVILGPNKSLAYLLADEDYDVWMGNSRGNTYSKAHVTLASSDSKFWDFSFHEMGLYDVPALVDYVLNISEQRTVAYVGHSQGVTELLVTLSEKPDYNSKISMVAAFAPMAFAGHMRSPVVTPFARISTPLYYLLRLVGVNSFLPTNAFLTEIGRDVCESRSVLQVVCSNALFLATGYDSSQINLTMVPIILGHVPAGASTKQFEHFAQLYNSKKFRQFDQTISFLNRRKYNQSEPPQYNLGNVRVPMAIFYGENDLLADYRDVEQLISKLPNVVLSHKVSLDKFNHIDFMYGINADELVYREVIYRLKQNHD